jgi:hypothetical protein
MAHDKLGLVLCAIHNAGNDSTAIASLHASNFSASRKSGASPEETHGEHDTHGGTALERTRERVAGPGDVVGDAAAGGVPLARASSWSKVGEKKRRNSRSDTADAKENRKVGNTRLLNDVDTEEDGVADADHRHPEDVEVAPLLDAVRKERRGKSDEEG